MSNKWVRIVACLTAASIAGSCASYNPTYASYYTFAQTRKVVASPANPVFKCVFAPLMSIPETIASPVTAYMDAKVHPPESSDGNLYMCYIGFRTIKQAMKQPETSSPIMYVALGFVTLVDTCWFPVAGVIDMAHIVTLDNPEAKFGETGSGATRYEPVRESPQP